jgi:daunorubicin resistance ABC transporter ATP-binding subunit
MSPVFEAHGLTKHYGKVHALDGLDLVADSGQVVALLGPNGAGKTTFVRMLATLIRPDGGTLAVQGIDVARQPAAVRRLIGLAGQYAAVEPTMTGTENLVMVGRLLGQSRATARRNAAAVLERLHLTDAGDRLVRTYSGGMRRRLDLGVSLVGSPKLLLLDEPTTGLDPQSRLELWDTVRGLVASGTDVLLTTQYLDEADHLAREIVIIDKGRVIAHGTPGELKSQAGRDVLEIHPVHAADLGSVAGALDGVGTEPPRVDAPTRRVSVPVVDGTAALAAAVRAIDALAVDLDDIALRRPTLDEVFLGLTGHTTAEDAEPALAAS